MPHHEIEIMLQSIDRLSEGKGNKAKRRLKALRNNNSSNGNFENKF